MEFHPYTRAVMATVARARHQPHAESFGERLARLRKDRGFTQVELAARVDMIQALISDYERNKLRPYADVVVRFARALNVTTDELLGIAPEPNATKAPSLDRRFLRRLQAVDKLPKRDQDAVLRTLDAFLGKSRTG